MANKKTNLTQTVIAFKKLSGVVNTSMTKTDLSETIGTSIQIGSNKIFAQPLPTSSQIPTTMYDTDAPRIVQLIQFDLVPVAGTNYSAQSADSEAESTTITTHSFALKLKDDYETEGVANLKAGTPPFTDGNFASGSDIQLVPPSFDIQYGISLLDQDGNAITTGDDMDWYFDYPSGMLFRQDGDNTTIPVSGSCYMYIGTYMDERIQSASLQTLADVTANGDTTVQNISVGPILKIDYGGDQFSELDGVKGIEARAAGGNNNIYIGDETYADYIVANNVISASKGLYVTESFTLDGPFTASSIKVNEDLTVGNSAIILSKNANQTFFNVPVEFQQTVTASTISASTALSSSAVHTTDLKVTSDTFISAALDTANLANSPYGGVLVFNTGSGKIFYTSSIGGSGGGFPFTGNAVISGSLVVSQSAVSSFFTGTVTASTWYGTSTVIAGERDASNTFPHNVITRGNVTGYESGSISRKTYELGSNDAGGYLTLYTSNSANITLENGSGSFLYISASDKAVLGAATIEGDINKVDSIFLQNSIIHYGDTDTRINFDTDVITFKAGNNDILLLSASYAQFNYPVTASSNISTSLDIYARQFLVDNNVFADYNSGKILLGDAGATIPVQLLGESIEIGPPLTASIVSASTKLITNVITASIISASDSITGSLYGTSSWAVSASSAPIPTLAEVTAEGATTSTTLELNIISASGDIVSDATISASIVHTEQISGVTSLAVEQLSVLGTGVTNYVTSNTYYVGSGITHSADLDTAIDFDTDEITLTAGGNSNLIISTNAVNIENQPLTASIISASSGITGSLYGTSSHAITASTTNLLQSLTANQNVGAISSGDTFAAGSSIEQLLRTMLITFIQSSIGTPSFKNNGSTISTGTREVSSSFDVDQVTFTAVANDPDGNYPINLTVTASGADTGNFTNDLTGETLGTSNTFNLDSDPYTLDVTSISTGYSKNITLRIRAEDPDNSAALTTTRNYTYVYPYYWGESATDLSTATGTNVEDESGINKVIEGRGNKTHSIAASAEYIYFAYPTLYGDLVEILDGTNVDVLPGNFTKYVLSLDGGNNWTSVSYNLYRSNTVTTVTGNYKFNFT